MFFSTTVLRAGSGGGRDTSLHSQNLSALNAQISTRATEYLSKNRGFFSGSEFQFCLSCSSVVKILFNCKFPWEKVNEEGG
jgi:hypothetical protein